MSAQLVTAAVRGLLVTVLTGAAAFGTLYGAGANQRAVIAGVIAAMIPVALGFLGYGVHDQQRAAALKRGSLAALRPSDIGYDILKAHVEARIHGDASS